MRTIARPRTLWLIGLLFIIGAAAAPSLGARADADDDGPPMAERLANTIEPARLDHVPARQAFKWWAQTAGIPLVINWDKLEKDGVDPQVSIDLDLHNVPARQLLKLMMQQVSDQPLVVEVTSWYVSVMTKTEANQNMVVRFYDVADLIHDATPVDRPPSLDLSAALTSNTSSGTGSSGGTGTTSGTSGGGSGSSSSIFGGASASTTTTKVRSDTERSEDLIKVIRDTIEPEIWAENGGQATIRFFQGRLIVKAPLYVQAQIGTPQPMRGPTAVSPDYAVVVSPPRPQPSISGGVAGVATQSPSPVAGVAGK